jgi:23S rRNA (cytidine1920-2'-O)/16S rRNA (cytidine1409-2'-O)-methyltransferase
MIDMHRVLVGGAVADKASRLVDPADPVRLTGEPPRYVSRGGEKLERALDVFGVDPSGRFVLDVGASTGGFTDCVLQRGAARVVALDVGHGQLHPRIRGDERVEVIERFNVRALTSEHLATAPSMIVADVSFISLTRVIPALVGVAAPRADLVLLVKPQFEAGRRDVDKGHGVITDPAIHTRVRDEIGETLERSGCTVVGWCDSPITGADGNHEFLVHATVGEEVSAG